MELVRQKNAATIITFPIVDADGDFVTGATGLDSEIDTWSDGAAPDGFTDCTNEATEVGSTGIYYLSLTQAEMNADYIMIQVKTTSSGAKTQMILINTMVGDPLNRATTDLAVASVAGSVGSVAAGGIAAASFAAGAIDASAIAANAIGASEIADGAIDAGAIAADAITAAKVAADVGAEFAAAFLDATDGVESSVTVRQAMRLILSAAAAKLSGAATTTVVIRDVGDTKDRITATVDANGNRTAVTLDAT